MYWNASECNIVQLMEEVEHAKLAPTWQLANSGKLKRHINENPKKMQYVSTKFVCPLTQAFTNTTVIAE